MPKREAALHRRASVGHLEGVHYRASVLKLRDRFAKRLTQMHVGRYIRPVIKRSDA